MKTLYRQDGSRVELDDVDAAKWLKMGLGTLTSPVPVKPAPEKSNPTNPVHSKGEAS